VTDARKPGSARTAPRESLPTHLDPRGPRGPRSGTVISSSLSRALVTALSGMILLVSGGGWTVYHYLNGNIHRIKLNLGGNRPQASGHGVENYLLVGTDSRAGTDGDFGDVPGQRSDSTMLVHLAADGTTTIVSFPRDTLVTIPEYTDGDGKTHKKHLGKFNEAISDGGASLLVSMVEGLTDIRIDHYVSMDLAGFQSITDAIGGVDVCVLPSNYVEPAFVENGRVHRHSRNTNDSMSGFVGGPGTVHVDGRMGLAFVRQRHGLPNGDIDRIRRQQQFLGAVFRKATTSGILANPIKLEALASTATSALTLDKGTSINDLKNLATSMRGVASGSIHTATLPTHAPLPSEGGDSSGNLGSLGAVQLWNPDDLEKLIAPLRGHPRDDAATGDSARTINVFNGSGITGAAARAADALQAKGLHAVSAGSSASTAGASSTIVYGPGMETAAAAVHDAVPDSILRPKASATELQLIVGSSFSRETTTAAAAPGAATGSTSSTSSTSSTAASGAGTPAAASTSPSAAPAPAAAPTCTY